MKLALCAIEPLVACSDKEESPVGVSADVVIVNRCGEFTAIFNGNGGVVLAPGGNPEIDTIAEPVKPFSATIEMVTGTLVVPGCTLTEFCANTELTES